jgi:RNA polymerase sigma factor (sigma-70 family)
MTAALRNSSRSVSNAIVSRPAESNTDRSDDGLSAFLGMRARLFGIAYRMLGSAAEAEDIVQDVWLRWQTTDRSVVRDAAAFLTTTARRLAINVMQSARARRETSVGPSQPEAVDTTGDPRLAAERRQALACGVRMLLEKLTPTERAAYILREAFDYAYRDIANVLRLAEANARQVVTRARQHVADHRGMPASSTEHTRLLDAFIRAAQHGEVAGLESLLASEAVSIWPARPRHDALTDVSQRRPVAGQSLVGKGRQDASPTMPAKLLVFLAKDKGSPVQTRGNEPTAAQVCDL